MVDQVSRVYDEIDLLIDRGVNNFLECFSVDGDLDLLMSADCRPIESYMRVRKMNELEVSLCISRHRSNLLPGGSKWPEAVPPVARHYPPFWDRSLYPISFCILLA